MKFKSAPSLMQLQAMNQKTMGEAIGLEFTAVGENWIEARMPVDHRTIQPTGLLHGGANVALAETLGSVAATLMIDTKTQAAVGLEINANHIRGVREGWVVGRAEPVHVGRSTQVWQIQIRDEAGRMVCVSRLTVSVIEKK